MKHEINLKNYANKITKVKVEDGAEVLIIKLSGDDVMMEPIHKDSSNNRFVCYYDGYAKFIANEENVKKWNNGELGDFEQ